MISDQTQISGIGQFPAWLGDRTTKLARSFNSTSSEQAPPPRRAMGNGETSR